VAGLFAFAGVRAGMTYAKGKAVGGDIHRSDGAVLGFERFRRHYFMWLKHPGPGRSSRG